MNVKSSELCGKASDYRPNGCGFDIIFRSGRTKRGVEFHHHQHHTSNLDGK